MSDPLRSTCAALLVVTALLPAAGGCRGAVLGGDGPMTLAAVDPDLLETARLLVFSFSATRTCSELVDLPPNGIGEALAGENVPLQPVDNDGDVSHVFGDVPPSTPIAFLVLASSKDRGELGQPFALADLSGSVFAMACRDYQATAGARTDLPMTLFPVGLR